MLTHDVCVQVDTNHGVKNLMNLGHHRFGYLGDSVRADSGLNAYSMSATSLFKMSNTYLIINKLLWNVIFFQERNKIDNIGILGWNAISLRTNKELVETDIIIKLIAWKKKDVSTRLVQRQWLEDGLKDDKGFYLCHRSKEWAFCICVSVGHFQRRWPPRSLTWGKLDRTRTGHLKQPLWRHLYLYELGN